MDPQKRSMPNKISTSDARSNFSDVVKRTYSGEEHFIVERNGLPVAAIISMREYELLQEHMEREQRTQRFAELARSIGEEFEQQGMSEEEIMAALEKAREEVHQETYGE